MSNIRILIGSLLAIICIAISFVHADTNPKYVPGISDLPVPSNFFIKPDSVSVFRSQAGRIIDASFIGRSSSAQIEEFYNLTLRALGWTKVEKLTYVRESEILTISTKKMEDRQLNNLEITFSIGPQ